MSVYDWLGPASATDTPSLETAFSAIAATVFNVVFPPNLASQLSRFLAAGLLPNENSLDFLESFQSVLVAALSSKKVKASLPNRIGLLSAFSGTFIKMVSKIIVRPKQVLSRHRQSLIESLARFAPFCRYMLSFGKKRYSKGLI